MWVSITLMDKTVLVTELLEMGEGTFRSTDRMLNVNAGQQLGSVSYEALRRLGEGEHDIPVDPYEFQVTWTPPEETGWGGYLFLALLFFSLAPVSFYWIRGLHERPGRVRVHWLIALAYGIGERFGIGGDWAVAGLMALFGLFFLFFVAWNLLGTPKKPRK